MEISFSRELDGSYLCVTEDRQGEAYTERMLTEARPSALLPLKLVCAGDKYEYRYEIGGLRSLEAMLNKREMNCDEIRDLLQSIYRVSNELEEYLLEASHLWLEPGLIFYGKGGWYFCLHAPREEELFGQLQSLSRFILKKADHEDEKTTRIAYELFRVCHEDNYSFAQIWEALELDSLTEPSPAAGEELPQASRGQEAAAAGRRFILGSLFGKKKRAENIP